MMKGNMFFKNHKKGCLGRISCIHKYTIEEKMSTLNNLIQICKNEFQESCGVK